ncbi:unnamed protein product [Coffea canephora]|uniref:Uncharacterized protein n=1 Tax=Coffea canephora TaxID=49390 RepID=A0A068VJW8_COFCA|nr:unnamed protein product [Coffea canephora]
MVFQEFEDLNPQYDTSSSIKKLALVASIAAAVHYGWALQLSLLTPYIQLLGVPHKWAAFVWLCGPISGLLIQPTIGHYSDCCTSRFGRRRPFIVVGAILLCIAVFLIGFAADIGHMFGDSLGTRTKPRAVALFVLGFWILDISNNLIQGPCRALLADLCGHNEAKLTIGNSLFAFFMAVGNMIGYALGSYVSFYHLFPFTKTQACDIYCANLKTCFICGVFFVIITTTLVVTFVREEALDPSIFPKKGVFHDEEAQLSFFGQLLLVIGNLPKPMKNLLIVTALNWIGWFPFTMFSTDWMGKEVYGGQANGNAQDIQLYQLGVWTGTMGLMLYVVVLGTVSLFMEPLVRMIGNVAKVWGIGNFVLAICMVMTTYITKMAIDARQLVDSTASKGLITPPPSVKISSLSLFAILGIPQAVTYSIPFALASIYSNESGTGQGLGLGVLNLAIVIPQMFVAVSSGQLDDVYYDSNLPAFLMGAIAAGLSGTLAFTLLSVNQQPTN